MNYTQAIAKSKAYIETHLQEDLTPEQIAYQTGYSTFHFCRVFAQGQGMPLMEYVRKQRLLHARSQLLRNCKIIEIALDYGFETASGFSKAFRKEFGYSPTAYLTKMAVMGENQQNICIGGSIMVQYNKIKKPAFHVAGYGIHTNLEAGATKDIAAYWDKYEGENLESKMYAQLNPPKHGEVGICVPAADSDTVVYLFGVVVDDFEKVTADMITITVPEAEYAVFTTPPVNNSGVAQSYSADPLAAAVKQTWNYIFEQWLPQSEYAFDETKVSFEFYDERCHGLEQAVMDIYVPIVPKDSVEQ